MSFEDKNWPLQLLAREVQNVRAHNLKLREAGGDNSKTLRFAEAALYCLALEHFVCTVVRNDDSALPPSWALKTLLGYATKRGLITLLRPESERQHQAGPWLTEAQAVKKVCAVRDRLLHGNFEQAAMGAGCRSVADFFESRYETEVETMYRVLDLVMQQVDVETGRPHRPQRGANS